MSKKTMIDMNGNFSDMSVLNKDFTRCRCSVFYTGLNRNGSFITDEALERFVSRKGYANVPIVGHLYEEDGKLRLGGHDSEIVVSDDKGIEIINHCTVFGCIPESCNPKLETIIEESGEKREYFSVDVILWTHRFPELMEASFSDDVHFNQSMEIQIADNCTYEDDVLIINDFSLSALCLLNLDAGDKNVTPAFESSRVKKLEFSLESETFKTQYQELMKELEAFSFDNKKSTSNEDEELNKNETNKKGEITKMDLTKFTTLLSDFKFSKHGEEVLKYHLLNVTEEKLFVLDLEDGYRVFAVEYAMVDETPIVNWESKTEGQIGYMEKSEDENLQAFSIAQEIETLVAFQLEGKIQPIVERLTADYEEKLADITVKFESLRDAYAIDKEKLEAFEAEVHEREKIAHREEIKAIVDEFAEKIGKSPEFMFYKAKLDADTATVEGVSRDLALMAGKLVMEESKKQKANFSYKPIETGIEKFATNSALTERYGNLLSGFED